MPAISPLHWAQADTPGPLCLWATERPTCFATAERFDLLEYPTEGSELVLRLTGMRLEPRPDGLVRLLATPGLGVRPVSRLREAVSAAGAHRGGGRGALYDFQRVTWH
jgi:hypothetical protein